MKQIENPIDFCVVLPDNRRTFDLLQSSVVALAKSQDHRVIYGVFCVWWLCNAVRRWLHLGIPCYTSELKQGRWAKDRAEWLGRKSQKSVRCDAMTWLRRGSYPQAERKLGFDSVRLCFAQTFTKEELMRICKCGGIVRQHNLTNNREAWTCNACKRYEIVELDIEDKEWILEQLKGVKEAE